MRAIGLGLVLVLCVFAYADRYVVHHVRPSKILAKISSSGTALKDNPLVPAGITDLRADDGDGAIIVAGSAAAVDQMEKILDLLDVAPRRIGISVQIESPADKFSSTTISETADNSAWEMLDGTSGVDVAIVPRINSDGTVTMALTVMKTSEGMIRAKDKSLVELDIRNGAIVAINTDGDWYSVQGSSSKRDAVAVKPTDVVVTVQLSIRKDPPSGPINPSAGG